MGQGRLKWANVISNQTHLATGGDGLRLSDVGVSNLPGGWLANKPAAYTLHRQIDFSQAVPAGTPTERGIGSTGFTVIFDDDIYGPGVTNFAQVTDGTEPGSPPSAWRCTIEAGDYGTFGSGEGHGAGNVGTTLPSGCNKLYFCYSYRWNTGYTWHTISTKHINLYTVGSIILIQAYETGGNWLRVHDLGTSDQVHPMLVNTEIPVGTWHIIEGQIEVGNPGIVRIWMDGVARTNSTALAVSRNMTDFSITTYRGGGGEDLATTISTDVGHIYLAVG